MAASIAQDFGHADGAGSRGEGMYSLADVKAVLGKDILAVRAFVRDGCLPMNLTDDAISEEGIAQFVAAHPYKVAWSDENGPFLVGLLVGVPRRPSGICRACRARQKEQQRLESAGGRTLRRVI